MNTIINKFLLAGDRLCLKCIEDNLNLPTMLVDHLLQTKKEFKNLKRQEIQNISTKMS